MHLGEALGDGARDCGQSFTTVGIYASLRARYGLFPREARSPLNSLRKDYRTTLAEHASEVERLVQSAYPDLPDGTKREMTLEQFVSTLDNTYLQRHLLVVDPRNITVAVRAGSDWLQIQPNPAPQAARPTGAWQQSKPQVRSADEAEPEPEEMDVKVVQPSYSAEQLTAMMGNIREQLSKMTTLLVNSKASTPPQST